MTTLLEYQEKMMDRYLGIQHSLWNALITLNAILIGVISVLYSDNGISKKMISFMFISILLTIILLITNYQILRSEYEYIANRGKNKNKMTNSKIWIKFCEHSNSLLKFIEYFSLALTLLNIFLIFITFTTSN